MPSQAKRPRDPPNGSADWSPLDHIASMAEEHPDDFMGYLVFLLTDPIIWATAVGAIFGCVVARAVLPLFALISIVIGLGVCLWIVHRRTRPFQ
jgi:hypothetical protein